MWETFAAAATPGLLLDLLASEDRRGVGEAMELLIEATERDLERRQPKRPVT